MDSQMASYSSSLAQGSVPVDGYLAEIYTLPHIDPPDIGVERDLRDWWKINAHQFAHSPHPWEALQRAADSLKSDDAPPVAFPTETVYGLGANATSEKAVLSIFRAKNRPADNPLIVHVASLPQLRDLVGEIPDVYTTLIHRFWPGPLTVIMPLPSGRSPFAPAVTTGHQTVGIRMPKTFYARLLISLAGQPIAAPSANMSGKPSPTTAQHVYEDMKDRVNIIIDGGPCEVGLESTVIDGTSDPPVILRPGAVSIEDIRKYGGSKWADVRLGYSDTKLLEGAPRAPGMKYRHYAPSGKVILCEAGVRQAKAAAIVSEYLSRNSFSPSRESQAIGFITTTSWDPFLGVSLEKPQILNGNYTDADTNAVTECEFVEDSLKYFMRTDWSPEDRWTGRFYSISAGKTAQEVARSIFAALRTLDSKNCGLIIVEGIGDRDGELAAAVMNRLRKAAEA